MARAQARPYSLWATDLAKFATPPRKGSMMGAVDDRNICKYGFIYYKYMYIIGV